MLIATALIVAAILGFVLLVFFRYCVSLSGQLYDLVRTTQAYHAVVFRTYRLKSNGALPLRGRLVAKDVVEFAKMNNCTVCIPVGEASEQEKPDSVINASYLREHGGFDLNIILGEDMAVRTTYEEVREVVRFLKVNGWTRILVIGELSHLPRIVKYWRQAQQDVVIHYWGTSVPWYYYPYSMIMIIAEILLPVGTRRRNWVLSLAHRGSKKK